MRTYIKDAISKTEQEITIKGWVHSRRDHGKIIFLDIRDVTGIIQAVAAPDNPEGYEISQKLRPEFVVEVTGLIAKRPKKLVNSNLETGRVEMQIKNLVILNEAQTTPFEIDKDTRVVNEDLRLKYRYLDLRSERMRKNMILRHKCNQLVRNFLTKNDFYEIETPFISKSTPEGARDFLVPSRKQPGKFYALPQSPQQYKQMLMVAGIDRYFQIVRCFRDEDERGQRQPEFTQVDVEMSFIEQEDILQIAEKLMTELVKGICPAKTIQEIPFPRLSFKEAMEKYHSDKPDLRKDKNDPNLLSFEWIVDFPMFEYKEGDKRWGAVHHPFTSIVEEDLNKLEKGELSDIKAQQYDLVLNGNEVTGGSIRTHDPKTLAKVFEVLGHSKEDIETKFGHLLNAFKYGVPPHGGFAVGYDRLIMVLAAEENIREVIAFPKNGEAYDPLMDSPSEVDNKQLTELGIKVI